MLLAFQVIEGVLKEKGVGGCGEKRKKNRLMIGKKKYIFLNFKLSNLTSVVLACGCPICLGMRCVY